MQERVPPDRDAADDDVDKALVQSQDLEHQRKPETRVSNTGVAVKQSPLDDSERRADEDEKKAKKKASEAVEEFEKSVREQIPG
jgi:hypothetical protein